MSNTQGPRRNHHVIPKAYLRGFVEQEGKPFLYIYRKSAPYNPGANRDKNNPYLGPLSQAGMVRDYYASVNRDGTPNYEEFEALLEQEEKPLDKVFAVLREQQMPDTDARRRLARYIVLMIKRVPHRGEQVRKQWPHLLSQFQQSNDLLYAYARVEASPPADAKEREQWLASRQEYERVMAAYQEEAPKAILHGSMFGPPLLVEPVIVSMTWRFLLVRGDQRFITSDNPVFFLEEIGLNRAHSELIFPISSQIVLFASWRRDVEERFVNVGNTVVRQINERIANGATEHLFSSQNLPELTDLLNNSPHQLTPLPF